MLCAAVQGCWRGFTKGGLWERGMRSLSSVTFIFFAFCSVMFLSGILFVLVFSVLELVDAHVVSDKAQSPISDPTRSINGVSFSTRVYWMRRANTALAELDSPCPFAAFGTVIVNHTNPASKLGELVCIGANANAATGNPTLHGEMAAIDNCTAVLTDPKGKYRLSPAQALAGFSQLSLYTNAESCPMCASAIRWSGFREYIYGTSIETLIEEGWGQIRISSTDVFKASSDLPGASRLLGDVLSNETDPYFKWQFNPTYPCPSGCARVAGVCQPHLVDVDDEVDVTTCVGNDKQVLLRDI